MPDFRNYQARDGGSFRGRGDVSRESYEEAAERTTNERGAFETIGASAMFGVSDLVDTVGASIGVSERESFNRAALRLFDSPGLNDLYTDTRQGAEVASAVYGVVASELLTRKLLKPSSLLLTAASKVPYARRIAALDKQHEAAIRTVAGIDLALARQGARGSQQYNGLATVRLAERSPTGGFNFFSNKVARNKAVGKARRLGFAKGARHAVVTEAQLAIAMNQNGFLFDDDMGANLFWMAAGVGIGGVADDIYTSYRIRKNAGADRVKRAFAGALDPDQFEEGRLLWHNKDVAEDAKRSVFSGAITDRVTAMALNADGLRGSRLAADDSAELLSAREALATQWLDEAFKDMQKVTSSGISTDGRTRVNLTAGDYGNHIKHVLRRDPGAMNGVEQLGAIPLETTLNDLVESRAARLVERRAELERAIENPKLSLDDKATARGQLTRLDAEDELVPLALVDGEIMTISEAKAFEGFAEPKDIRKSGKVWQIFDEEPTNRLTMDDSLILYHPSGKNMDTADHYEVMRAYRLAQRVIDNVKNSDEALLLPEKPTWFQLDIAEEILNQTNGKKQVVWPEGMTRESAQVESFAQKAAALRKRQRRLETDLEAKRLRPRDYEGELSKLRMRYNLPRLTAYERAVTNAEEHSVEALMRGADAYGPAKIRKMSLRELQQSVAQHKRQGDLAQVQGADESILGKSFQFGRNDQGQPIKPMLMLKRNTSPEIDWSVEVIAERMANEKHLITAGLLQNNSGPMSQALTRTLLDSPDTLAASRTHEILETQIQGSVLGSSPQSPTGSFGKAVVTSEMRDRDAPVMLAATRVRDTVDRLSRDLMKRVTESAFGDNLSVLRNPRNASTRLLLNQYHSFRSGWNLKKEVVTEDGFTKFVLSDSEANRTRFKNQYGREMPENQFLLSPDQKPVVLDELGWEIQQGYNKASDALIREKNTLLKALGRNEIRVQSHWTAPPNTKGKLMGFIQGPDGEVVPGYTVVRQTQEQFDSAAREAIDKAEKELGSGYIFRTQDDIGAFSDIWDRVQMQFINPGTTAVQANKSGVGKSVGQSVNLNAFQESLDYIRDGFLNHGNDLLEVVMKESIQSARARAAISRNLSPNNAAAGAATSDRRGVYDYYLENLLGKSKLNSRGTELGGIYNPIEGKINGWLESATPMFRGAQGAARALNIHLRSLTPGVDSEGYRQDFNALRDKLGEYMPFQDAAQMAARRSEIQTPLTVEKITTELNKFSAALILRMFEVAHPVMNLGGMVNAMPSVIRHMRKLPNETDADWADRIGHSSQVFNVKGESVAVPDMTKIAARAFKNAWSRERHADYDYMVKRGYLSQEVAEFQRQFGAIDSKGRWEKFFYGDGEKNKGVVGWTGILSDKSEDFSRSWGHMVGLEVADVLRISGNDARHAFAHDMANKMIANYNPHNRPEILQGALGAPIGLFQSFIINYYQRLFRYAETKDYRSFATQYAVQAGLFGVPGVTGFDQISGMMQYMTEGERDLDAEVYSRFGGEAGDLLAGGVLSNLPKMFGAPAVDLYARGDTNVRVPGIGPSGGFELNSIPAFNVLGKIKEGIGAGLDMFSSNHPGITSGQLAEVASNMMSNRPMAGIIEQAFANGFDTDRYGQVVSDTANNAEIVYRSLGVRSMRQSKEIAAFYNDKDSQEFQIGARETLRLGTRAAIRDGREDLLPEIFETYIKQGGSVRYFRRWMLENIESATQTRSKRRLEGMLNDPTKWGRAMQMMDQGVSIREDDELGPTEGLYGTPPSADVVED